MSKPTLLVLAAGMGSRFGGLKQMARVGPGGETLLDYAVHDAVRAGFGKIVFVIRPDFAEAFRETVLRRLPAEIPVDLSFQDLTAIPPDCRVPPGRTRPWGTGHAVMVSRAQVREPFAVINADDFYGADAYARAADFVRSAQPSQWPEPFGLVAFALGRTLTPHGTVSRGICEVDGKGFLLGVTETTGLRRAEDGAIVSTLPAATGLAEETPVSMNFFVFQPSIFAFLEDQFRQFFAAHGSDPKAEFYLPTAVATMIERNQAKVRVMRSSAAWMGVTYAEDQSAVQARLAELHRDGCYGSPLWG
jgi:hypothetical protein